MLTNILQNLSKYQQISIIILGICVGEVSSAYASNFNAGVVMNKMTAEQRTSYIMGLVDGLAYSRWQHDKPSEVGMKCIYDWYFQDNAALWKNTLAPTFERYKGRPATAILYVLTKKECGA